MTKKAKHSRHHYRAGDDQRFKFTGDQRRIIEQELPGQLTERQRRILRRAAEKHLRSFLNTQENDYPAAQKLREEVEAVGSAIKALDRAISGSHSDIQLRLFRFMGRYIGKKLKIDESTENGENIVIDFVEGIRGAGKYAAGRIERDKTGVKTNWDLIWIIAELRERWHETLKKPPEWAISDGEFPTFLSNIISFSPLPIYFFSGGKSTSDPKIRKILNPSGSSESRLYRHEVFMDVFDTLKPLFYRAAKVLEDRPLKDKDEDADRSEKDKAKGPKRR